MADTEGGDELAFSPEEVDGIVTREVDGVLGGRPFDEVQVPHYINLVCEKVMKSLLDLGKPFKYIAYANEAIAEFIVNCTIMQKNGAGLIQTNSCYWDSLADGSVTIQWPKPKDTANKTMFCITNVYAIAM